jgi:hypothetical protein
MTVASNPFVDSTQHHYVIHTGDPIKIPASTRSITVLAQIPTSIRAITQNLAGTILLDTPVFAVDVRLQHYSNTGATVVATDSLALSIKQKVVDANALFAVGVYIERIDQTDNDVYLDLLGVTGSVVIFECDNKPVIPVES